jgi:hypothetical protein
MTGALTKQEKQLANREENKNSNQIYNEKRNNKKTKSAKDEGRARAETAGLRGGLFSLCVPIYHDRRSRFSLTAVFGRTPDQID